MTDPRPLPLSRGRDPGFPGCGSQPWQSPFSWRLSETGSLLADSPRLPIVGLALLFLMSVSGADFYRRVGLKQHFAFALRSWLTPRLHHENLVGRWKERIAAMRPGDSFNWNGRSVTYVRDDVVRIDW